jgi:hypothetical protein
VASSLDFVCCRLYFYSSDGQSLEFNCAMAAVRAGDADSWPEALSDPSCLKEVCGYGPYSAHGFVSRALPLMR